MTLERFGFIGMDKKCFWGMVGVDWLTPLKVHQIKPGNEGPKKPTPPPPKPKTKPKPKPPAPKPKPKPVVKTQYLSQAGSKIVNSTEADSIEKLHGTGQYFHKLKYTLLYQATKDGWKKKNFLTKVVTNPAVKGAHTLHIFKASNGAIFGGIVPLVLAANPTKDFKANHLTFMFYIKNGHAHKIKHKAGYEIRQEGASSANMIDWYGAMDFTQNCNAGYNEYLHMMSKYWYIPGKTSYEAQKTILGTNGVRKAGSNLFFKCAEHEAFAYKA